MGLLASLGKHKKAYLSISLFDFVVELAGVEPMSRTRQPSVLHAYFVFFNNDYPDNHHNSLKYVALLEHIYFGCLGNSVVCVRPNPHCRVRLNLTHLSLNGVTQQPPSQSTPSHALLPQTQTQRLILTKQHKVLLSPSQSCINQLSIQPPPLIISRNRRQT